MPNLYLAAAALPFSSQIMASCQKKFTAEKTLSQFDFGLASGLLFFLYGFTECSCTILLWPLIIIDQEAFKNDVLQVD